MKASFNGLLIGLVGAIILVYMLIVVNFQSLLDPFIIITALPAALAPGEIVWMLFLTHTTVSVPALTVAHHQVCMGVATGEAARAGRELLRANEWNAGRCMTPSRRRCRPALPGCARCS